jgi:hypothetical protein
MKKTKHRERAWQQHVLTERETVTTSKHVPKCGGSVFIERAGGRKCWGKGALGGGATGRIGVAGESRACAAG